MLDLIAHECPLCGLLVAHPGEEVHLRQHAYIGALAELVRALALESLTIHPDLDILLAPVAEDLRDAAAAYTDARQRRRAAEPA